MKVEPEQVITEYKQAQNLDFGRSIALSVTGLALRGILYIVPRYKEKMIDEITTRVRQNGYIDELSQDELDLLPKGARRKAFHHINMNLIAERYKERIESRWLR